jgi:hypothetical protein
MTKDTGTSAADFITNDGSANRTVTGTLSSALGANERVEVSFDGGSTWTTATTIDTNWSVPDPGAHSGDWVIQARVTDTSSHLSGSIASQTVTLDVTGPAMPTVSSAHTTSTLPTLTGTASLDTGETLSITVNGATYSVGPTGGTWTLDLATAIPASGTLGTFVAGNVYSVSAVTRDTAGNTATDTTSGELTIDLPSTPPTAPTQTIAIESMSKDTGISASDFVTRDGAAGRVVSGAISATLGANEQVEVSFDGGNTWNAAITVGANWTVTDASTHSGDWTIQARVVNTSSHLSGATTTQAVVLDTTAPTTPTVDAAHTSTTLPTLTGTASLGVGETLSITINGATYTGVPTGGRWTLDLATAMPLSGALGSFTAGNVYSVTAIARDAAGNAATDATSNELTIDFPQETPVSTPPTQTVTIVSMTKDTGISASDFITNDGSAGRTISGVLSGGLGANEVMQLSFDGGATWTDVTVNRLAWSATDNSAHATSWTMLARVINTATNVAGPVSSQAITLILIPPAPVDSPPAIVTPTDTAPTVVNLIPATAVQLATVSSSPAPSVVAAQSAAPAAADTASIISESPGISFESAPANRTLYTRATGFQIIVLKSSATSSGTAESDTSSKSSLLVNRGVPDVDIENTGREVEVAIPRDAFAHTRDDAVISLTVVKSDGTPLPFWLRFDPRLGVLRGVPPAGIRDEIEVRVIARDQQGNQVETTFRIRLHVGEVERSLPHAAATPDVTRPLASKAGLTTQLHAAGKWGRAAERERLLAAAKSERLKNVGHG